MTGYAETALVRGMQFLAESQATVAHNLANANSLGFKRRVAYAAPAQVDFGQVLDHRLSTAGYAARNDLSNGSLTETGGKLHVAIEGPGFFLMQTKNGGTAFSRDGSMRLDTENMLVNTNGDRYLDVSGQPINLGNASELDHDEIRIGPDGTLRAGKVQVGQIGVYDTPNRERLMPMGAGMYADRSGQPPVPSTQSVLRQGNLERSNVDTLTELVNMITVQRGFETTSRILTTLGRIKNSFTQAINR